MPANKSFFIAINPRFCTLFQVVLLAFVALCLSACNELQDRLVWSPDGKNLAVISQGTLCLWNEEKGLSPVLLPKKDSRSPNQDDKELFEGVRALWWLPQPGEAIVQSQEIMDSWQKLLDVANDKQKQSILESAAQLKGPLIAAKGDVEKLKGLLPQWENLPLAYYALGYLALHDADDLKQIAPKDLKSLSSFADVTVMRRYHIDAQGAVAGDVFLKRLGTVAGLRLSKDGNYLLWVNDLKVLDENNPSLDLNVVKTSAPADSQIIAHSVGPSADWSQDGRSVVYFQISDKGVTSGGSVMGSLVKIDVRADDGSLLTEADRNKSARALADLRIDDDDRLRCLASSDVLMSSGSTTLPARADEPDTENLFLVKKDGPLNSILTGADRKMLGDTVSFFELNPSQTKAVIATKDGRVNILDLQSGSVQGICLPDKVHYVKEAKIMPSWKSDDELLFVANEGKNGGKEEAILLLWSCSKGAAERFGSTWPVKLLDALQK